MQCDHQNVYFGVVNIRYQNRTIGAIDVWRCVQCKTLFCEEKQLGILDISADIGMPNIASDQRWAVLVCNLKKGKERWALVGVRRNCEIKHICIDKEVSLPVSDYRVLDDRHWMFMVDEKINKEVEID
ncbi:MAG: hypothetical protein QXU32_04510 [Nitrososphaerales archaeon]